MRTARTAALAFAGAIVVALAAVVLAPGTGAQSDEPPPPLGKQASAEVKRMLGDISARNIEGYDRKLVSFGTRHTLSSQTDPERGIGAARDWIFGEFQKSAAKSGGRMTVEKQSYVQEPDGDRVPVPTTITNVVATLRGTRNPDRTYVVSGHYDSRCTNPNNATCDAPGANDDASGVSAVIEMARVMATRKFDATIVFMAVAGEEQGLYGSTHYAEQAKQSGQRIDGMFTNDIIGSSLGQNGVRDPNTVRLYAEGPFGANETAAEAAERRTTGGENDSPARQLARYAKDAADQAPTDMSVRIIYRLDRYLRGGDHRPFLERRYPAARFTEVNEDYRHEHQDVRVENGTQFGDLLQFVDFGYIARVAKVNAATLAGLASAPGTPTARVHTSQLSVDTDLEWDASPEADLAGYEIVYRNTIEPYWTNTIKVPKGTTRYLVKGITKDNFLFGVRAVDTDGNRSPVAFPHPVP